jgi:tetratricopeptide (TPR) repeat protein
MTICNQLSRLSAAAALVAALSACNTTPPPVPAVPQLQDLLADASKASAAGDKEAAVALWKKSAEVYPKEKAPWSSIAQTRYEAGQYGDAIQAALEVLVRDPNDTVANSIIAVSGLRLSTRALNDLSRQNNLSGSIKTEAQDLAKLLRQSLGSEGPVLVTTPAANGGKNKADSIGRGPKTGRGKGTVKPAESANSSADPFSGLR